MSALKYSFYATLLDKYESYINSSAIYQQFWGFAETPEKTEEQFEEEQFKSLIDTINRVPFESEKADKGTAFNEVVDCLIENRKSDKMTISVSGADVIVSYKTHNFKFSLSLCQDFAKYFEGAVTQERTEAILPTKYGNVLLYGYIDEIMPFKVADIKTTSKYFAFKFKNNWQHHVYPYCLIENGINIPEFEYRITDFKSVWSEFYTFNPDKSVPLLTSHCEGLIDFIETNRHLIINKKIFCLPEAEETKTESKMENVETHEAEETTEKPIDGAIEIGEPSKEVVKFEDKVIIPAIPQVLNIKGVELDNVKLRTEVDEIKLLKIDGIEDKKGYKAAEEKLKRIAKLRTSSEAWRKEVMKPVNKFGTDLKAKIDLTGSICSEGEAHLKKIISEIDEANELAAKKLEEEKTKLAETRTAELLQLGMVLRVDGQLETPLDDSTFIQLHQLKDWKEEDYQKEYLRIKGIWDAEQERLEGLRQAEENEKNALHNQLADLNAERTEMRKEILEMRGFQKWDTGGWSKGDIEISEEQILSVPTKAEWDALFVAKPKEEVAPEPAIKPIASIGNPTYAAAASKMYDSIPPAQEFASIADDFVDEELQSTQNIGNDNTLNKIEALIDQSENPQVLILNQSLSFSNDQPFIDVDFEVLVLRIYPTAFKDLAVQDVGEDNAATKAINEELLVSIIQK